MTPPDKQTLRASFRERRLALDPSVRQTATSAIIGSLRKIITDSSARSICLYWPLIERGEIDLRPLVRDLWETGFNVSLPVVVEENPPRMKAVLLSSENTLHSGRWGLMEPHGEEIQPDDLDLIVVPALAVDRSRNRLGYGKGFYDAFLSRTTATTVCAVFDVCLVENLPTDPHDQPVDMVVTESILFTGD